MFPLSYWSSSTFQKFGLAPPWWWRITIIIFTNLLLLILLFVCLPKFIQLFADAPSLTDRSPDYMILSNFLSARTTTTTETSLTTTTTTTTSAHYTNLWRDFGDILTPEKQSLEVLFFLPKLNISLEIEGILAYYSLEQNQENEQSLANTGESKRRKGC